MKKTYPVVKVCEVCGNEYETFNRYQAVRNKTCSKECALVLNRKPRKRKPDSEKAKTLLKCELCGKEFYIHTCYLGRNEHYYCSRQCNGKVRGQEWKKFAHLGRANWTDKSNQELRIRMVGSNNPAWKGGVTYFKKHGNYAGVVYVRSPYEYLPMARKDGYIMEHRLVMAKHIGRLLKREEIVHHIDHNPSNNEISNLMLFPSNKEHKKYEWEVERNYLRRNQK